MYITTNSSLSMSGSKLSANQANSNGGGINIQGSAAITDTVISGNLAIDFGGGLFNNGNLTLTRTWLTGNTTFNSGGGSYNNGGIQTINQSAITGNNSYFGGGIYAKGTLNMLNTTVANNQANYVVAYGGGIFAEGMVNLNFVTLLDNLVVGTSVQDGPSIYRSSGVLTLKNTVIKSAASACAGGGAVTSIGFNIATDGSCGLNQVSDKTYIDPQLGPLSYHGGPTLTAVPNPGSPALDNGQCSGINADQRGVTRPQGAACDSGAVERLGAEFIPWLYLPLITR
jgi:hypothetical protein